MRGLVGGLLLVMAASIVAFMLRATQLAHAISAFGTMAVIAVTLVYVVALDSRKRWPGVPARERLNRVLTFYRAPR